MKTATHEFIESEFGRALRYADAHLDAPARIMAAYDALAATIGERLTELLGAEEIGFVDTDILTCLFANMTPHEWKMLAINLFNDKEGVRA